MHALIYLEMNIVCVIIMALIFFNIYHRREKKLLEQKLFLALLFSNTAILLVDAGMWTMDGRPGASFHFLNMFMSLAYYILNPLICMLWYFFVDYKVYKSEWGLRKRFLPLCLPFFANIVLTLASLESGILFYIDSNNVYHRGEYFFLFFIISYFYVTCAFVLVFTKRNLIRKEDFLSLLFFPLPPYIGGIIQCLHYGLSLIWAGTTISILVIFINIQNHQLYTDYLTGLFNRRQLDTYLLEQTQRNKSSGFLAGIMLDLDFFKMINDQYGHDVGDEALKETARILTHSFRKNDFIARYGGDEFVIIMDVVNEKEVEDALDLLEKNLSAFNTESAAPYTLKLTYGVDLFSFDSELSSSDFLKRLDQFMYENKLKKE